MTIPPGGHCPGRGQGASASGEIDLEAGDPAETVARAGRDRPGSGRGPPVTWFCSALRDPDVAGLDDDLGLRRTMVALAIP